MSLLLAGVIGRASGQTTITGSSLSHRSSGSGSGNWTLTDNGYVGTYFTLASPGQVTLTVNASGSTTDAVLPHMNLVVADSKTGFDVGANFTNYQQTMDLAAGTYFVRTEFNNDVPTASRQLTVSSLKIEGATSVSNTTNQTTNNASALAAADTYVANYRKGPADLSLVGVAPGSSVRVKLRQHDFRFGTAVGGVTLTGVNNLLNNPSYTNFLLNHFNAVTPSNAGKWASNEATRDHPDMLAVDRILQFAEANKLRVRMHNLLWADSQQPTWATTLLNNANSGNATAKADLRTAISKRIDYYVGNNDADTSDDRARRYLEMDLLNEHRHLPKYWNVYGAAGIADIFNETASAVSAAGANTKLFLNEYNVLQYGADSYGNWYRQDVEALANNGGAISGIGVQYYPFYVGDSNTHSPARINQIFQNLAVSGLPIALTEFGVQTNNGTTAAQAATFLTETMRMVFGSPDATTFALWGFWGGDVWSQAPLAALADSNWNLTAAGTAYEALMNQWSTDVTLPVDSNGRINFAGFYGDYDVTINGHTYSLSLKKGTTTYSLITAPGDYNGDGTVDAADYIMWRSTTGSTIDLRADGNGDRVIDDNDFAIWRSTVGTNYSSGLGATSAIPEPTTIMLVGFPMACFGCRRTRQQD